MFRSFFSLSIRDQWLFLRTTLLLIAIRAGLVFFSIDAGHRLGRSTVELLFSPDEELPGPRIARAVRTITRRLFEKRPCLTQALAVELLFKRMAYPAVLQIGVTKSEADELEAHAWVESDGTVVIGGCLAPERYERLEAIRKIDVESESE